MNRETSMRSLCAKHRNSFQRFIATKDADILRFAKHLTGLLADAENFLLHLSALPPRRSVALFKV